MKFTAELVKMMLKESDLYKIKQKSAWDDDTKSWRIPVFTIGERKADVAFPTINGRQRAE